MANTLKELIMEHQTYEVDTSDYVAYFICLCGESVPQRWGEMGDAGAWHAEHLANVIIQFDH